MTKQAILIMAHFEFSILEKLLKLLDDSRFDIYLHIDSKVKKFDFDYYQKLVNKSNLYFTKRLNVKWGTYSQIECELTLLKSAIKNNYKYYHLISGVDLPIKSNSTIYDFFDKENHEFVGFSQNDCLERIKYYHLFLNKIKTSEFMNKLEFHLVKLQEKIKVNRIKKDKIIYKKGCNWFSITNDLAKYVISQEKFIKNKFKYSKCADEMFLQTLVYNSSFKDKVYKKYQDEHQNVKRLIDWKRGEPYTYSDNDYQDIINSNCFFVRKVSTNKKEQSDLVDKIYEYVRNLNES